MTFSEYKASLKTCVKNHPRLRAFLLLFISREARTQFVLRRLVHWPQKQVDYLIKHSILYGYGRIYPRTVRVDLSHPKLFNEKLLWLKYYHYNQSPLAARCNHKYYVREYVEQHGCGETLNELYGVWNRGEDIPWDTIPENCIIKKASGSGNHVIRRDGAPVDVEAAKLKLRRSNYDERRGNIACGELFYIATKQMYLCEKLLTPPPGQREIDDYKFYCFHGEPRYLLYIWDREGKTKYAETFKRIDPETGTLTDASELRNHAQNIDLPLPESFRDMLEVCRKLAAPFPFVRVDLYDQNGSVVFGELTFTPAGSHVLAHVYRADGSINVEGLTELGNLITLPMEDQGNA